MDLDQFVELTEDPSVPTARRQTRRVATTRRESDGALVLRLDPQVFVDLDQAATMLAVVYAGQRVWHGLNAIQDGLQTAARERVLDHPGRLAQADADTIAAYRQVLLDTASFPDPATDHPDQPLGVGVPYRRRVARYRRPADGAAVMRIDVVTWVDLQEAATALALTYAGQPLRVGLNAILAGMTEAVSDPATLAKVRAHDADPATRADYRQVLLDTGIFTVDDPS